MTENKTLLHVFAFVYSPYHSWAATMSSPRIPPSWPFVCSIIARLLHCTFKHTTGGSLPTIRFHLIQGQPFLWFLMRCGAAEVQGCLSALQSCAARSSTEKQGLCTRDVDVHLFETGGGGAGDAPRQKQRWMAKRKGRLRRGGAVTGDI